MTITAYNVNSVPLDEEFAKALIVIPDDVFWTCLECRRVHRRGQFPCVIEWTVGRYDTGSDKIGDFTWHGASDEVIVTDRLRRILESKTKTVAFGDVEMWQNPRLKKPKRITKRTKPRVWLPYDGPPLWDLEVNSWCELDWKSTGLSIKSRCSTCDDITYSFPQSGSLVINPDSWDGSPIFKIREYDFIFVTEDLLDELRNHNVTNFSTGRSAIIPE